MSFDNYYQPITASIWNFSQDQSVKKAGPLERLIVKVETLTYLRREQLAQIGLVLLSVYFVMSSLNGFLYTAFGVYYPLYQTVKAISIQPIVEEGFEVTNGVDNKDQMHHWLAYWATYAAISSIDLIGITLTGHAYLFVKTLFLIYLYLPQTSGALTVFEVFVKPVVIKIGQTIASAFFKYHIAAE